MNRSKVIIIAASVPLDNDEQIRRRMIRDESRTERQSSLYPHLGLPAIQKSVNENIGKFYLHFNGRYMNLFDLMNFVKNHRRLPELTPDNVKNHYSLADTVTLNGIYLYQYLVEQGYDPIIVQNYAISNLPDLLEESPLAVCVSSNFMFMDDIWDIAAGVKQIAPEIPVIAGGLLVKRLLEPGENLPPQTLRYWTSFHGKVDAFVVEAQGEQTLVKVLGTLKQGGRLGGVPNLAFFNKAGNLQFTSRQEENLPIDSTAIAWDKIPKRHLRKTLPVNSSRGCSYKCRFCTFHWFFPEIHYKSLEALKRELRLISGLGFVEHVRFTDDNFTANRARLKAVLEMMIKENFDFTWSSYARASALTPDLLYLIKASGCEFLLLGLESGSQTILDNMDKKLKREQSLHAVEMLNEHDIKSKGSFIIGFPGETIETFSETIDFINESDLPYYHAHLYSHSNRALVNQEKDRFGLEGIALTWRHRTMNSAEASHLMSQMIRSIPRSFTDGDTHIEETYKQLRQEGYGPGQIYELFRLKRDLQLSLEDWGAHRPFSPKIDQILTKMELLVGRAPC
jgi:p-methyltransferase